MLYVCASEREGLSTTVIESLLVGTPVCTVDVGGMKEILMGAADDSGISLGEAWLPKNIKVGAAWKAPKAQYGKTRKDSDDLTESFREEKLNGFREEAQKNG